MTNKETVKQFVEAMRTSDTESLKSMITDDFNWWIAGHADELQTAGEHDRDFFLGFFGGGVETFPNGVEFQVTDMVAEGDKVAAEARLTAETAMGSAYDNRYHFLFTFNEGRIKQMKEYMDTHHAKVTFGL